MTVRWFPRGHRASFSLLPPSPPPTPKSPSFVPFAEYLMDGSSFPNQQPPPPSITTTGFFQNAQCFTVNGGQFVSGNYVNQVYNIISKRDAVFELLEPYTCLAATKDSGARYPPPRCHDRTRLAIRNRLRRWLADEYDGWKMLWVRGYAGTGKSAVAQSFGESCDEEGIHGGTYFFSRTAGRNKLETVVPTIAYQLAATIPEYRSLIGHQLANNPLLLHSSLPVQFRNLIVEPFAILQRQYPRKPIVIILDGLDECEGEKAQREILEMITNAIRTNPNLPLRWLIFSRPEAHLKNIFSRNLECGREELIIDEECRENVERYVRDKLTEIKTAYNDIMPNDWPPQDKLQELLDVVSGLFVLASTCLNCIDDPDEADPGSQLDSLLAFMRRSRGIMSRNPLEALDLLYSRILQDIPSPVLKTTWQILAYISYHGQINDHYRLDSAQALANFLRLDRPTFYKAVRGLHSVMYIPESEDAAQTQLKFYHASFLDFLIDPHRSGKFVVGKQEALAHLIHLGIYWTEVDVTHFHADGRYMYDHDHSHDSLPGLTWAYEDNRLLLSQTINKFIENGLFNPTSDMQLDGVNEDLLSVISDIDFRYWRTWNVFLLARLCQLDPSTVPVVRIEPSEPTDHQLLEGFMFMIGNGIAKPVTFPLRRGVPAGRWVREYFFIGHGTKSVLVWRTKSPLSSRRYTNSIRCDRKPSGSQVRQYQKFLRDIKWDEEKAKLEME